MADLESGDKRTAQAVRLRKFIDVIVEDKLSFTLYRAAIADLSATGMRVVSDQYLPKGSRYTFTMKKPPHLALRGEIRWVRTFERDTFQVGVLFVDMTEEDQRRLQSFIDIERSRVPTS